MVLTFAQSSQREASNATSAVVTFLLVTLCFVIIATLGSKFGYGTYGFPAMCVLISECLLSSVFRVGLKMNTAKPTV